MTETGPEYVIDGTRLPRRAWNLAMRVLQLERECNGNGRLTFDVIFIDGVWLLNVTKPGDLEHLVG